MAHARTEIIEAIRRTANKLQRGSQYMWGHMGSCNCGNLAQEVTKRSKAEIHAYAMQGNGDWNEQLNDYCETSAMPIDLIIFELITSGFSLDDLQNLEKLSDKQVLMRLPVEKRYLRHNVREDVIVYLNEWADMLEEQLLDTIKLPDFLQESALEHA